MTPVVEHKSQVGIITRLQEYNLKKKLKKLEGLLKNLKG